jgi:hypothetical protein
MPSFYVIYVEPNAGVTRQQLEEMLNKALDWYRYNKGHYVVYTSANTDTWYNRLAPLVTPNGYMFICRLDKTAYHGWMPKDFWEWFQKVR